MIGMKRRQSSTRIDIIRMNNKFITRLWDFSNNNCVFNIHGSIDVTGNIIDATGIIMHQLETLLHFRLATKIQSRIK